MLAGWYTVLLRVSASRGAPGHYLARVFPEDVDRPAAETRFRLDIGGSRLGELPPSALTTLLAADPRFVADVDSLLHRFPYSLLLVDLRAASLYAAPWEQVTRVLPFASGWSGGGARPVLRYSPDMARLALVPLVLPADVLVAEMHGWTGPATDVFAHPLKHFRAVIANRLDIHRLRTFLASTNHDVVHLRGTASWQQDEARFDGGHGDVLEAKELRRLVRSGSSPARLVVLETDVESLPAMTDLGHRIAGRDGPAVLVTPESSMDFDRFYYGITHDQSLVDVWFNSLMERIPEKPTVLLIAHGSEAALSLSQAALDLEDRLRSQLARIHAGLSYIDTATVGVRRPLEGANLEDRRNTLQAAASGLARMLESPYMYDHESQGMEPMTAATVEFERMADDIDTASAAAGRVVNTWFTAAGELVSPTASLRAGATYHLEVNVGPRLWRSNVRRPEAIPEQALEPLYEDSGLPLRVVVFSADFSLSESTATLVLPRPPASATPVSFRVEAPEDLGPATLRVALYYQNNLLQSLVVTAEITPDGVAAQDVGNFAELEWVISDSLVDLDRFGEKSVNILTNETPKGTHLFGIVGTDLRQQIELGETEMIKKISEARKALQWVCGDRAAGESYRYEPSNVGDGSGFTEHMAGLAEFGYDLYVELVTGQDKDFEGRLAAKLADKATIQVAVVKMRLSATRPPRVGC